MIWDFPASKLPNFPPQMSHLFGLGRVWTLKFVGKMFATKRLVLSALIQHDLRLSRLKLLQMFFHKSHIYMVWDKCEHSECVETVLVVYQLSYDMIWDFTASNCCKFCPANLTFIWFGLSVKTTNLLGKCFFYSCHSLRLRSNFQWENHNESDSNNNSVFRLRLILL